MSFFFYHFALVNLTDISDFKKEKAKYGTLKLPYREEKKINDLALLAAANVNSKSLLDEIRKAAERRKAK